MVSDLLQPSLYETLSVYHQKDNDEDDGATFINPISKYPKKGNKKKKSKSEHNEFSIEYLGESLIPKGEEVDATIQEESLQGIPNRPY